MAQLDPPHRTLLPVLVKAGVQTWADMKKLAKDEYAQDEFLNVLLRQKKVTPFEYALLKSAFRTCSSAELGLGYDFM